MILTIKGIQAGLHKRKQAAANALGQWKSHTGEFYSITLLTTANYRLCELWAWGYNPRVLEVCLWGYRIEDLNKTVKQGQFFKDYDTLQYAYDNFLVLEGIIKPDALKYV